MDTLINIIVTIAIIIAVLKRMGEVTKKGGDITRMPTPDEMFPDRPVVTRAPESPKTPEVQRPEVFTEEPVSRRRFAGPDEEPSVATERERERTARMQERLREIERRLNEQRVAAEEHEKTAEEQFETVPSDSGRVPKEPAFARSRSRHPRKAACALVPVFGTASLAQGIVMSEILGPPVSLREGGRY